jgi:H+/gluconate symporter-like permease
MYFAYKGWSVILIAPVFALMAAATSGLHVLPAYTELFMVKAAGYFKSFFPLFMLGAVFGKVMEDSGAASSIAHFVVKSIGRERAVIAIVVACGILTYGGVSLFVVAFAVYPFAAALFREADYPKRLIPGCIALGAFTFTMTAIPGTPQIQNMIPTKYFGTDAYAAPLFGTLAGIIMFVLGVLWLEWRKRQAVANGEGYGNHTKNEPEKIDYGKLPNPGLSILPMAAVLILNFVLTQTFKSLDPEIMKPFPGASPLASVAPTWALIVSLVVGIVLVIVFNWKEMKHKYVNTLNTGTIGSLLAIMNTASEVGYGNVISSLTGFNTLAAAMLSIKGTPLLSEMISVNVLAGITGSASGGMSIALETMGKQYLEWATKVGVSPELLHRVASLASGGFDTLPHNGAVITLLAICGLTHRESYPDIGMVSVVIPFITLLSLILIWTALGLG